MAAACLPLQHATKRNTPLGIHTLGLVMEAQHKAGGQCDGSNAVCSAGGVVFRHHHHHHPQGGAGRDSRAGITGALPSLFVDMLLLPHGAPAPHDTFNTGAEALPPWQQQQQPGHPPWTQPGGLGGPVQPGGQAFVSRWDTGSRETSSRGRSRGSDSDRDWESEERGHRGGREVPTASVFLKGLPYDADESDIHAAFASFPNILSVKVLRDRTTGHSKGTAFLDFASVDDARVLMESEARYSMAMGSNSLYLDYATGPPGGGAGAAGGPALDWICDMCSAVNFARRLECYHCSTARPVNPKRVTADLSEPSNILKVSGLEPHTSEEALYQALSSAGQHIADMRVIKDKFTGAPRGFAFVELSTVAAADAVMLACQGVRLPGQLTPLKICYAKAKESMMGSAAQQGGAGAAPAAAAAAVGGAGYNVAAAAAGGPGRAPQAHAAAGPLGWKPKEFNPDGSVNQDPQPQQQQQQQQPTHTAATAGHATHQQQQQQQQQARTPSSTLTAAPAAAGPGPSSESAAAAAAVGVDAATIQALTQAGFEYQASSGYWWDPKSGYFYDAKTQLYYHHSTNQWYQYSADTGQYTAVGGGGDQQQQQQQKQGPAVAVDDKRRRAVIGSAPQYNPEGLLAAAALAEERAAEERRVAAAKAARERQQQQQQQQSKQGSRQQPRLMQGKPGLGCLPGTGSVPAPPLPPPTAAVVADGNLRGVVYRSKWSQQRAQAQHQH